MTSESIKSIDNIDLKSEKISDIKEQVSFFKNELNILKNNVGPEKPSFKEYEPYQLKAGESIYDIAKRERLMELTGKNIYDVCEAIKSYNIQNQTIDSDKKSAIIESTDINAKFGNGGEYIWMPKLDEYKLTEEEMARKNNYEKLFEGKYDLNKVKNLKWGSVKLKSFEDAKNYVEEYYKKLIEDGYEDRYFATGGTGNFYTHVYNEFKEYNQRFYKKHPSKDVYNGVDDNLSGEKRFHVPLYKLVTPKTIVNDLTEKEKYSDLDEDEKQALEATINKMEEHKRKYAILVNASREKAGKEGLDHVVLYDLESKSVVRKYICSTGTGRYNTPKGIWQITKKVSNSNKEIGIYRNRQTKESGYAGPLPFDANGNYFLPNAKELGLDQEGKIPSRGQYMDGNMTTALIKTSIKGVPDSLAIFIHGINRPDKLGKDASSGCVRMLDHDVAELYDLIEEPLTEGKWKTFVSGTYLNIMR